MAGAVAQARYEIRASDKTKTAVKSVNGGLKSIGGHLTSVKGQLAAVAGVGGFGLLIKSSFDTIDTLAKTADKLGVTTEGLAGLRHAAELSGVATRTFDMGLQRMTRRIAEAAQGTGEAKAALIELGLNAQSLAAAGPEKAFSEIAEAMQNVNTQADKVRLGFKLFDSEGVALVNTLADGAEGLREAAEEANALGLAVSRLDAAKIEESNNQWERIKAVMIGIANAIAIHLAPILSALADQFVNTAKEAGGMNNFIGKGFEKLTVGISYFADFVQGLKVVFKGLTVIVAAFISATLTGLDEINKAGMKALNWLPGFEEKPSPALSEWAYQSQQMVLQLEAELMNMVNTPMPSSNVKQWFDDVYQKAEVTAQKIADAKKKIIDDGANAPIATPAAGQQSNLVNELDKLQQQYMSEGELLALKYENEQFIIEESLQNQLLTDSEHKAMLLQAEQAYQQGVTALADEEIAKRLEREQQAAQLTNQMRASVVQNATALLQQFEQKSRAAAVAAIILNKAWAIAETIQNTAAAAMKAVALTGNPAAAAPIKAMGSANVALIGATGLGQLASLSGGGASAGSASNPVHTTSGASATGPDRNAAVQQQTPPVQIVYNGDVYGLDDFQESVEQAMRDASSHARINVNVVDGRGTIE